MAKNIPAKEFKAAIKSLNVVLKADKETPIKIVGVKKEEVVENFTNTVIDYIDNKKEEKLPDEVIAIYNDYIAVDGDEEEEEKTPAKGKGKGTTGKGKGTDEKDTPKPKKKGPKTKSVVEQTVDLFMKNTSLTNKEIVNKLEKKFPDRNIASTVSSAMCVLKHVEKHLDD